MYPAPLSKWIGFSLFVLLASVVHAADPVKAVDDGKAITLDNGIVAMTIDKASGRVTSMRFAKDGKMIEMGDGRSALAFDFDAGNLSGNGAVHAVPVPKDPSDTKLINQSDESAEVAIDCPKIGSCQFETEMHLILQRGRPGFYTWIRYAHTAEDPACILEQTRIVVRTVKGTALFTNYVVNPTHTGPFYTGTPVQQVFDTTWLYGNDPIPHSKYETCNYIADDLVHGMAGHGTGIWLIQPSREYVNGGPLRQELTVHQDSPTQPAQNNILLWMLQGNHFGGAQIRIADKQVWSKFYGPAFIYLNNGDSVDDLYSDAKKMAAAENAKWPYDFVKNSDYPLARGTVAGTIKLADGTSAKGAWVVLATPDAKDWCETAAGYEDWTKADADGKFSIPNVRPGKYKLFVSGADQFDDFTHDGVVVLANQSTDLGTLNWMPITHGRRLWQIGVADHSSAEFKNGEDYRHFDNDERYLKSFPDDVTYIIGKSKPADDWNFSQWGWYNKQAFWAVHFDQPAAGRGKATLTIGFTAFDHPQGLQVSLNDQKLGEPIKFPKTGMAAYRCGRQDSNYHVASIPFDASLIKAGSNELRLTMVGGAPHETIKDRLPNEVGAVMYDAVRLEMDENAK